MEVMFWVFYIVLLAAGILFLYCDEIKIRKLGKIILIISSFVLITKLIPIIIANGGEIMVNLMNLVGWVLPILIIVLIVQLMNHPDKKKRAVGKALLGFVLFWLISGMIAFILLFMTCFGVIKW